jgi:YfiH family protein
LLLLLPDAFIIGGGFCRARCLKVTYFNSMKIDSYFPDYVLALFSEKSDGAMNLSDPASAENRTRFLAPYSILPSQVAVPTLIHSNIVESVGIEDILQERVCDALVTGDPDVFLSVTAADCPSLFLFDPVERVLALAHCGWRGIASNIVHHTIRAMAAGFGVNPANIQAFISPGIRSCHFEVQKDVWDKLMPFLWPPADRIMSEPKFISGQRNTIDLTRTIVMCLIQNGLPPSAKNIRITFECTFCQKDKFFSWRRDHSSERMMAVMGMRKTL